MPSINQTSGPKNYVEIAEELEKKAFAIAIKQQWEASSPKILKVIRSFFDWESKSLLSIGKNCQSLLDQLEKRPTVFHSDQIQVHEQNQAFETCLKVAKSVVTILSNSKSNKVKAPLNNLMLRVAGLQYRIEGVNGGLDRSAIDQEIANKLTALALEWKKKHPLIVNKEITTGEIKKLELASTYPAFTEVLLGNRSLKETFFNWTLRDNNNVSLFVEFPATAARIKSAFLTSRIGRLNIEVFHNRMKADNASEGMLKNVVLPFFNGIKTEVVSILDESREVELNGGIHTTIGKILNVFSRKNMEIGNFEIFKQGIMNWNSHQVGSLNPATGDYDRVDLAQDDWMKLLPVLDVLTKEKLEERIGGKLADGEMIVFAKSSRTTPDFDLDGRHGFFEMAIPTNDGNYSLYPFGIFPETFPNTTLELVVFLGNTFRAKVSYPDGNFFYSHRQQAEHPIRLTSDEARDFTQILRKELVKSRLGYAIFQFGAENCAYWSQNILNTLEAKKHNFYKTPYVESYPLNPILKKIFGLLRSLPKSIRNNGIGVMDMIFGSCRGVDVFENQRRVFKSHRKSPVRNEFVIYQPGYLHQQILEGKIKGKVTLGSC